MSDNAFLSQFIEEPIYLIEDEKGANAYEEASEVSEVEKVEEPKVEISPLPTLGTNLKHCIILVNWTEEISTEKELLLKIMASVKRSEDDVLIAMLGEASQEQIEALLAEHNHRQLLDFGTNGLSKTQQAEHYSAWKDSGKTYLKAHSLAEIAQDVDKKKLLWKELQQIFLS